MDAQIIDDTKGGMRLPNIKNTHMRKYRVWFQEGKEKLRGRGASINLTLAYDSSSPAISIDAELFFCDSHLTDPDCIQLGQTFWLYWIVHFSQQN